jgi:hypothetical protein
MTPQSAFMVLAPIDPLREPELRRLLASMNGAPGHARADNALVPFGRFDQVHVARFLILDDKTLGDHGAHGAPTPSYTRDLAFLGEVDGEADAFLADVTARASEGLRAIFSCCEGFSYDAHLLDWMRAHQAPAAAAYVNWRGRTVRRVREDAALREALERHVDRLGPQLEHLGPDAVRARLRALALDDAKAGRISLSPEAPTPLGWSVANLLHLASLPAALVAVAVGLSLAPRAALPVVAIALAAVVLRLRQLEKTDPELCAPPAPADVPPLAAIEDHDVTNQFSAMGSLKPGPLRLVTAVLVLWVINWAARHLYKRGRLARVRSIHFARWVFLNRRRRVLFISNYDGSVESYMDDFINKVGFGLNVVFSNGIGYPRTRWLLAGGCADERQFKDYLRRHQMPTQVWYKAYPGLTAVDLERNARLRRGIDAESMSSRDAAAWVGLL